jgi:hypothetical protein
MAAHQGVAVRIKKSILSLVIGAALPITSAIVYLHATSAPPGHDAPVVVVDKQAEAKAEAEREWAHCDTVLVSSMVTNHQHSPSQAEFDAIDAKCKAHYYPYP